jgi:hypothetical protein
MAELAKNHGFKGIFFDNEEYKQKVWNYPDDAIYKNKNLQQYRDQAQLRGQQIMQAIIEVWPDVKIISLHGPYLSENRPENITLNQAGNASQYELLAPLYIGMMTAMNSQTTMIDGGEVYQYRTVKDFQDSYTWRKFSIATSAQNSPNIPESLRLQWSEKNNISFGVYPYSWPNAIKDKMDASIMRTTLENALRTSDSYVWYYFEQDKPEYFNGTLSPDWKNAISEAIYAANSIDDNQAPTVPGKISVLTTSQSFVKLSWGASTDSQGVGGYDVFLDDKWTLRTVATETTIYGLKCNTSYSLSTRAYDSAYNYSDKSKAANVLTTICSNDPKINLLINPGFESQTLSEGWTADWGNSILLTNSGRNDSHALKVGPGEGGRAQFLTSGFKIGYIYTLSAWAKLVAEGSGSTIGVICKNSAGARLGTFNSAEIINTESYEQKKVTFTIPENTSWVEIFIWHTDGTPDVLLDDYELISGSSPLNTAILENPLGSVKIYPNPLSGNLLHVRTTGITGNKLISVFDMIGNLIIKKQLNNSEIQVITINDKVLKGIYIVQIEAENINFIQLLSIQ